MPWAPAQWNIVSFVAPDGDEEDEPPGVPQAARPAARPAKAVARRKLRRVGEKLFMPDLLGTPSRARRTAGDGEPPEGNFAYEFVCEQG
ncbi:hypothetical protein GCM10010428_06180 [Actinosynnema pretiosum subsp. pretiosum]